MVLVLGCHRGSRISIPSRPVRTVEKRGEFKNWKEFPSRNPDKISTSRPHSWNVSQFPDQFPKILLIFVHFCMLIVQFLLILSEICENFPKFREFPDSRQFPKIGTGTGIRPFSKFEIRGEFILEGDSPTPSTRWQILIPTLNPAMMALHFADRYSTW